MFNEIIFMKVLGLPLLAWGGMVTFLIMVTAASMPFLGKKGIVKDYYKIHVTLAVIAVVLALIHGVLGILAFL